MGNLVTYVAVGAALAACVSVHGSGVGARSFGGALLAVAALADLYDGRFARLFPRTDEQKRFGVQIDSLSYVLSFGLAPVVVLAHVTLFGSAAERAVFSACGFAYLLCAVTRLAYYNVKEGEGEQAGFVGVPTTLFGLVWSAWLLGSPGVVVTSVALVAGGAAMVAPLKIARPGVIAFVVLTLAALGLIVTHALREAQYA